MNRCFWKHPDDVISRIKTRSARKNEPSVGWRVITKYYGDKQKDEKVMSFDKQRLFILRLLRVRCVVVIFLVL